MDGTNPPPDALVDILKAATRDGLPGAHDLPAVEVGPSRTLTRTPISCINLAAIAAVESEMMQFCEGTGRTVISFDCGYGIMQVTSGASNFGSGISASLEENVGAGAEILVGKWNAEYGGQIGDSDPLVVESWYYAFWAYNGFVYSNHPENPSFPANRAPWNGPGALSRGDYPYQELVLGVIRNPFLGRWDPVEVTYPEPGSIARDPGDLLPIEPEHRVECPPPCVGCDAGVVDAGPTDSGIRDANPPADARPNPDAASHEDARVSSNDAAAPDAWQPSEDATTDADATEYPDAELGRDVLRFRPGHEQLEDLPTGKIGGFACRCMTAKEGSWMGLWVMAALLFLRRRVRT